jgi:hypothetical protein
MDIASYQWDITHFGDVLEHVRAPVAFLSAFHQNYGRSVKKIVSSVPRCTGEATPGALRSREMINCFEYLGETDDVAQMHHLQAQTLFGAHSGRSVTHDMGPIYETEAGFASRPVVDMATLKHACRL